MSSRFCPETWTVDCVVGQTSAIRYKKPARIREGPVASRGPWTPVFHPTIDNPVAGNNALTERLHRSPALQT